MSTPSISQQTNITHTPSPEASATPAPRTQVPDQISSAATVHTSKKSCCRKIFKKLIYPIKYLYYWLTTRYIFIQAKGRTLANMCPSEGKGFFYKVKDAEGNTRGYILGTMHIADLAMQKLHPSIWRKFNKSTHAALEVDPWDPAYSNMNRSQMRVVEDEILGRLDPQAIHSAKKVYKKFLKSHFLISKKQMQNAERKGERRALLSYIKRYDSSHLPKTGFVHPGIDVQLREKAFEVHKPIVELEERQTHIDAGIQSERIDLPNDVRADAASLETRFQRRMRAVHVFKLSWMNGIGNQPRRYETTPGQGESQEQATARTALARLRDDQITASIERMASQPNTRFMALFGAAHLGNGEDDEGVIRRLRQHNWTVEQVVQV